MSHLTATQSISGTAQRRTLRHLIAVSAAVAAVFGSTQALPSANAMTPGTSLPGVPNVFSQPFSSLEQTTSEVLLDADDTFNPAAILNNEAIFMKHAWEPISQPDTTG